MNCGVKIIFALFLVTLSIQAASSDPGKVALDFLEKVRTEKLNPKPGGDTALSAQTEDQKQQQIARRFARMSQELGADPLEVGDIKVDENLAGVIVRKVGVLDPKRFQIFAIALVKRGEEWIVAPVPASFDNTGIIPSEGIRQRIELLENWMLREQVADLEKLREQSASRIRQKIETRITADDLRKLSSKQVVAHFLGACKQQDVPMLLGLLGGLAAELPNDWSVRLKAAEKAVIPESPFWRRFVSSDVIRVQLELKKEDEKSSVYLACLDAKKTNVLSSPPHLELVHFHLTRSSDQLWQINLPAEFPTETHRKIGGGFSGNLDQSLLEVFPGKFSEAYPATPQPTPELAQQAMLDALQNENLTSFLKLLMLEGSPKMALNAMSQAMQFWWIFHAPITICHPVPIAFIEQDKAAAGIIQLFSPRDSNKFKTQLVYFVKSENGWLWKSEPDAATREKFKTWASLENKKWPEGWQALLLNQSPLLEDITKLQTPTKNDAQQTVEAFLDAAQHRDFRRMLLNICRLNDPKSGSIILQNLGYEINGVRQ